MLKQFVCGSLTLISLSGTPVYAAQNNQALLAVSQEERVSLNNMVKLELESFYLYTALEVYLDNKGLTGMGKWAKVQANEELGHFRQHVEYAQSKDVQLQFLDIKAPSMKFGSPLEGFKAALAQEKKLGNFFANEKKKALQQSHFSFANHLNKFVMEQDEEVDLISNIVNRMTIAGSGAGLILMDQELGKRKS